jgi:hypothetical protein
MIITKEQYKKMYDQGKLKDYSINHKIIDSFKKPEPQQNNNVSNNQAEISQTDQKLNASANSEVDYTDSMHEFYPNKPRVELQSLITCISAFQRMPLTYKITKK